MRGGKGAEVFMVRDNSSGSTERGVGGNDVQCSGRGGVETVSNPGE